MGFILMSLVLIFLDHTIFHSLSLSELLIVASVLCATDTVSASAFIKVVSTIIIGLKIPSIAFCAFRLEHNKRRRGYYIVQGSK